MTATTRLTRTPTQTVLLLIGGSAGAIFFTVFSLLGAFSPSYDSTRQTISSLEFVPLGYVQQVNFVVFGLLQIAFAYALRMELRGGKGAVAIPAFQVVCAGGVIGDGFFTHDPAHLTFDLIAFNSTLIVLFLFGWRFWGDRRWRGWPFYSFATAIGMMVCLTAFGMVSQRGGPAGLFERMAVALRMLWSIAFVSRLLLGNSLRLRALSAST
jgi:hypothetical membrane protein